jgi:hypothetical protein
MVAWKECVSAGVAGTNPLGTGQKLAGSAVDDVGGLSD